MSGTGRVFFCWEEEGRNIRSEEYLVEDGPNGTPSTWEIELVRCFANLLNNLEGAVALVVELLWRSVSGNVLSFHGQTWLSPGFGTHGFLCAFDHRISSFVRWRRRESAFGFFPYFRHFFSEFDCWLALNLLSGTGALVRVMTIVDEERREASRGVYFVVVWEFGASEPVLPVVLMMIDE